MIELGVCITFSQEQNPRSLPGDYVRQGRKPHYPQLEGFVQVTLPLRKLSVFLGLIQRQNHLPRHRKL